MITKLTCNGYVLKVRRALEKHHGSCAVISTDVGLQIISAQSVPSLLAVYDVHVLDRWLHDDAVSFGLRE